ncbi:MAG: group 1 truncated hemoglobin [Burkholderiaceae bacterium]
MTTQNPLTAALLAFTFWAAAPAWAQTAAAAAPVAPSGTATAPLYVALGEKAGIRAVMDDLVLRLATDARTAEMFKETNRNALASQLTNQACQLAGGPCVYKGPDMKESHENLKITKAHFNALVEMAQQAMAAKGVPFATQNQLLALLAPMHRDVITVR